MPVPFTRGGLTFTAEEYVTGYWRPTKVTGSLSRTTGASIGKRKGNLALCQVNTSDPSRTVAQLKLAENRKVLRPGQDGGHLVALELGGLDHPANVVPMPSYFNRHGPWRELETLLSSVLARRSVEVDISVTYPSASDPVPSAIAVKYTRTEGSASTPTDPPREVTDTITLSPAFVARTQHSIPSGIHAILQSHEAAYRTSKGLADTAPLPYAYLDYINTQLNGGLATVHSGSAKFTELQRNYVWALNCWNHNGKAQSGFLVSDVPATEDRYWQLSTKGCLDFPQVDHILPKSKGGNNAFANAQLTSAWYNNDKKDGIVRDAEQRRQSLEARLKLNLRSNAATGHRASIKEHFESTYLARLEQEDQRQQKKAKLLAERRATATPPDTI